MSLDGKPPLVLFEDDHLLAVNKPSGINTHKPDRYAQDGIHEWLQKQRPEWCDLSILHRLDKETSGVMVFGKTALADKSLTQQFERGLVKKAYLFLTPGRDACATKTVSTPIQGQPAITSFRVMERRGTHVLMEAQPATGRTHQVRIHAAEAGFPVVGDRKYGSTGSDAPRLMLHAAKVEFTHPSTGDRIVVEAPKPKVPFQCNDHYNEKAHSTALICSQEFRALLFDPSATNSCRLIAGAADGFPGLTVDCFGDAMLVQRSDANRPIPDSLLQGGHVFFQEVSKGNRCKPQPAVLSPATAAKPPAFLARENGLDFVIRMDQGFSPGLFLDQRENRRHLPSIARGKEVLNCFAYTCSFSVAAAAGGGKTTSVDLSRSYLEWGRENFRVNGFDPADHDFIYGDVFDWLKRFAKRGRRWDIVLLDPPTFGTTKKGAVFRAAKDYRELVRLAVKLVRPGGALFCSTNQRSVAPADFVSTIADALSEEEREVLGTRFETQPFDFRVAEGEKACLKTLWTTIS